MAKCLVKARPREVPQLATSTPGAGGLHAIFLPLGLGGRRVGYERHQPHRLKRTSGWMPLMSNYVRSKAQTEQLKRVWDSKDISRLDYVTAWHAKALSFLSNRRGLLAFVTTDSIVQGDQVPLLFRRIFEEGRRIRFAHRTFTWDSEAPGKAAFHCVIIGFDRRTEPKSRLWDYPNINDEPITTPVERC